jgi:long-subunit acyl-CoA synthetase (AMP-forming)
LNFGNVLFYPIHEGMGGRIRYFISGGSALNEKVQRDFQGLGFTILEGYGLTEASPVLTVTRPENRMLAGTVGKSLPGVEIRIAEPDAGGVGEVIARGPNVMVGYYGNEEATRQTLVDRWLYTGDLGRLDDEGNLYLVGRSKEIIVDTNGKNVYPDELKRSIRIRLTSKSSASSACQTAWAKRSPVSSFPITNTTLPCRGRKFARRSKNTSGGFHHAALLQAGEAFALHG